MSTSTESTPPASPSAPVVSVYIQAWADKARRMKESRRKAAVVLTILAALAIGASILIGEATDFLPRLAGAITSALTAMAAWITSVLPFSKPAVDFLTDFVTSAPFLAFLSVLIPAIALVIVVQVIPAFLVWWERKVAGHMQGRLGPMDVGPHGLFQTVADGIKLFLKEIIEPDGVDKWVFRFAPVVVFLPAYLSFAPLPFGDGLIAADFDIGLLYVMAISGLSTIGVLMAGWGSANKFSILGGLRAAAQIVSFEIPRVMSVVPVVMWAGSMSFSSITAVQQEPLWGFFPRWFIFYPVIGQIAFVIYLITTIAETNRVPFDIPEAESELVAGFHTEYGGIKFAIFFLSEYAYVFVGSVVGTALFLGGGAAPLPFLEIIPSWAWFLAKTFTLIFVFLWARWTLPRLRVDRVMDLCWKVFLPWTIINIFMSGGVFLWRNQ